MTEENPFTNKGEELESDVRPDVPDVDGPSVDVPEVEIPEPENIPNKVSARFWSAVAFANISLLSTSLGLMYLYFNGDIKTGGTLIAIGGMSGSITYKIYRKHSNEE